MRDAALAGVHRQDDADEDRKTIVILAIIVGCDVSLIYYFWNYGTKKAAA